MFFLKRCAESQVIRASRSSELKKHQEFLTFRGSRPRGHLLALEKDPACATWEKKRKERGEREGGKREKKRKKRNCQLTHYQKKIHVHRERI